MFENRSCSTCIHDGQCVDLHYCGGSCWSPMYGECVKCGDTVDLTDCCESNKGDPLCERCAQEYEEEEENGEEG